jgi:hypothetical protein
MTTAQILRRLALVAAAALLAVSIGAKPLYAVDAGTSDNPTDKKADHKAAVKPAKMKREKAEDKTPQPNVSRYRPDAVPGTGY